MQTTITHKIVIAAGVVALLALAAFAGRKFLAPAGAPVPDAPAPAASGFPDSSTHVSASFARQGQTGVVTLHTASGWHVNANPVSLEGLIPATVWIEQDDTRRPAQASYPPGQSIGIAIDDKDILVYKDRTRIEIAGLDQAQDSRVLVHMQSCSTQGICLAPATIVATHETD